TFQRAASSWRTNSRPMPREAPRMSAVGMTLRMGWSFVSRRLAAAYALSFFAPSPLQGEGWDGGRRLEIRLTFVKHSNPPPSPPPNPPPARGREHFTVTVAEFPRCARNDKSAQLNRHRRRFPPANAQRCHAELAAGLLQGTDQRDDDARTGGADGMAERASAA